ncbi:MAG: hypothetical protein IJ955_01625 [Oscillospiraceae bacterium]|nr:hypothetical protein [Oscillospiraceae bacterium]
MKQRTHRLTAILVCLLLCLLPVWGGTVQAAEFYNIWVGGTQLTSTNLTVSGTTGTATLTVGTDDAGDPTYTLTLDNYTYEGAGYDNASAICSNVDLTIALVGENTVTHTGGNYSSYGIKASHSLTISGTGTLSATGGNSSYGTSYGINAGDMTVENGTVIAKSGIVSNSFSNSYGIHASTLTVENGTVTATGGSANSESSSSYGISIFGNMTVENGSVTAKGGTRAVAGTLSTGDTAWYEWTTTEGGAYSTEELTNDAVSQATYFSIRPVTYNIWVGGTQLTSANLTVSDDNGGTATLAVGTDGAGDPTYTLTLDNYTYEGAGYMGSLGSAAIYAQVPLTIELVGDNSMTHTDDTEPTNCYGIVIVPPDNSLAYSSMSIGGEGTLTVIGSAARSNSAGIYVHGSLSITGGEVTATGGTASGNSIGIYAQTHVNISGGSVTAKGGTRAVNGTLSTGDTAWYEWTTTEGGTYSTDTLSYNSGKYLSIRPKPILYNIWVGGTQLTSANLNVSDDNGGTATLAVGTDDAGDPIYTLTLDNYTYEGAGYDNAAIYAQVPLTIELAGENRVTHTGGTDYSSGIFADSTVSITGNGTLTATGGTATTGDSSGIYANGSVSIEDGTVEATGGTARNNSFGIYTDGSVSISGGTVTATSSTTSSASYDIYAQYDVNISGGTVTATDGTANYNNTVGIRAGNNMNISGGSVTATCGTATNHSFGIRGNNNVSITGGSVTADGGTATNGDSYGIYTDGSVSITDSTVTAKGETQAVSDALSTGDTAWYAWRISESGIYFATPLDYTGETYLSIRPKAAGGTHDFSDGDCTCGCEAGYVMEVTAQDESAMTAALTNHTTQTTAMYFMAAVYDSDGKMVEVYTSGVVTLAAGKNVSVNVSYGSTACEVKLFALSANTTAPLCESGTITIG